jgi:hypothetical protein
MTSGISDTRPRAPATVIEQLTPVADRLRSVRDRVGLNPWRTFVVAYRWTGGARGRGKPELVKEIELTPRPRLVDAMGLKVAPTPAGLIAEGVVRLVEISPRYVEDDLDLLFQARPADEEVLIEMRLDGRDGPTPERYAFRPAANPSREAGKLAWALELRAVHDPRTREGTRRVWSDE